MLFRSSSPLSSLLLSSPFLLSSLLLSSSPLFSFPPLYLSWHTHASASWEWVRNTALCHVAVPTLHHHYGNETQCQAGPHDPSLRFCLTPSHFLPPALTLTPHCPAFTADSPPKQPRVLSSNRISAKQLQAHSLNGGATACLPPQIGRAHV